MGLKYFELPPRPEIESVVKNYFVISYDNTEEKEDYLLPNGTPSFFYLYTNDPLKCEFPANSHSFKLDTGFYAAYFKSLMEYSHKETSVVGATIYPLYLEQLFGITPTDFMDTFREVEKLPGCDGLPQFGPNDTEAIVAELDRFITKKIVDTNYQHQFAEVYHEICQPLAYQKSLEELAGSLGYSYRHMSSMFKKHLGLSPKQFFKLIRFNRALQLIDEMENRKNLSRIAHIVGYHDQAHFIRDFKSICGKTPKELALSSGALAEKFRLFKNG